MIALEDRQKEFDLAFDELARRERHVRLVVFSFVGLLSVVLVLTELLDFPLFFILIPYFFLWPYTTWRLGTGPYPRCGKRFRGYWPLYSLAPEL